MAWYLLYRKGNRDNVNERNTAKSNIQHKVNVMKQNPPADHENKRAFNPQPDKQIGLLRGKRFAPFFWTQFLGAFNDNIFKNALILMIAFQSGNLISDQSDIWVNLAAGFFILPFFLFSATAGQVADKFEKSFLIRRIKLIEIAIMALAGVALFFESTVSLIGLLFVMGAQSAFFGPVKYSIMPQHLKGDEIVRGNALVEMGTFVSILLGTLCGGMLIQLENGNIWTGIVLLTLAVSGWVSSRSIPEADAGAPDLAIRWNLIKETAKTIKYARKERSVFLSIIGISWFWFLGASYLTQLPNFTKEFLKGSESVVTLLLALFSIGVGVGSLLCERLSKKKVELGLVPLGAIGLSIFGFDLFFSCPLPETTRLLSLSGFWVTPGSVRILADFILIGVSGGLYIVPLFAFVQMKTPSKVRARVIAANNIMNALFMVLSSVAGVLLIGVAGLSILQFFLLVSIVNVMVAIYIYSLVPEFTMRFLVWMMTHTLYRVNHKDLDRIPEKGAAVLVCNHVSYMDGLIIAGACKRPVRFVMYEPIYRTFLLNFIFRTAKAIPISSGKKNPAGLKKAFDDISNALDQGEIVCIFPEGRLTKDGDVDTFRPGIERIIKKNPVPVVPMALKGLWGSFFSHKNGHPLKTLPRRFWSKIELKAGLPIVPSRVSARHLYNDVKALRGSTL